MASSVWSGSGWSLLPGDLTTAWERQPVGTTHLSVFVAGNDDGLPAFWVVSNGDLPAPSSASVPTRFEAVNDLAGQYATAHALPSESLGAMVARMLPTFRRGALSAADILDRFANLVGQVITEPGQSRVRECRPRDRRARGLRAESDERRVPAV